MTEMKHELNCAKSFLPPNIFMLVSAPLLDALGNCVYCICHLGFCCRWPQPGSHVWLVQSGYL